MFRNNIDFNSFDPELYQAIKNEEKRQHNNLELIASENYASPLTMKIQGSQFTNKYAEGYPGKRYYGGCKYADIVEQLAIKRLKKIFDADYANVQPHSGSQANIAVYTAIMQPGDTMLGMSLDHGGHLTHGSHVNFSGKLFKSLQYGLNSAGDIDYKMVRTLAEKYRPKVIIAGFSAFSKVIDWEKFSTIASSVGAYFMVDMAHIAGLIAAGLYPNPIKFADIVTSTTHKTLRGPRGGVIMCKSNPDLEKKLQSVIFPGTQGGPLMHVIAAKASAFKEALQPEFKIYQKQVLSNAKVMVSVMQSRGVRIVSGGTENHLFLIDLSDKDITGKKAEQVLELANITVNKNSIPDDPCSPFITSGLRIGTPAITTRGFKNKESEIVAHWICDILENINDENLIYSIKEKVITLCDEFPVYS